MRKAMNTLTALAAVGAIVGPAAGEAAASTGHVDGWVTAKEVVLTSEQIAAGATGAQVGKCAIGAEVTLHNGDSADYLKTTRDTAYHSETAKNIVSDGVTAPFTLLAKPSLTDSKLLPGYTREDPTIDVTVAEGGVGGFPVRDSERVEVPITKLSAEQEADCTPLKPAVCEGLGTMGVRVTLSENIKTADNRVKSGSIFKVTQTIGNTGKETLDANASSREGSMTIPKNASAVKLPAGARMENGRIVWDMKNDLASGKTTQFSVKFRANSVKGKGKIVGSFAAPSETKNYETGEACDTKSGSGTAKFTTWRKPTKPTGVTG